MLKGDITQKCDRRKEINDEVNDEIMGFVQNVKNVENTQSTPIYIYVCMYMLIIGVQVTEKM